MFRGSLLKKFGVYGFMIWLKVFQVIFFSNTDVTRTYYRLVVILLCKWSNIFIHIRLYHKKNLINLVSIFTILPV